MTSEEVKAFLSQGYYIEGLIKAKREQIEHLRQIAESITAEIKPTAAFSSMPSKKVENCACCIADLQNEICDEVAELVQAIHKIKFVIKNEALDNTDRHILELRYINYMKWEEIAVTLNYAYRWVMRRHKRALAMLAENWPC